MPRRPRRIARTVVTTLVSLSVILSASIVVIPPAQAAACTAGQFTVTRLHSPIFYTDFGDSVNGMYLGYAITNTTGAVIPDLWVSADTFSGVVGLAANEDGIQHFGRVAAGATVYAYFYVTTTANSNAAQTHQVKMFGAPPTAGTQICESAQSLTSVQNAISAAANKVTAVTNGPTPPQLGGIMTITVTGDTGQVGGAGIFAATPAARLSWPANAFQMTDVRIEIRNEGAAPGTGTTYHDTLFLNTLSNQKYSYTIVYTFTAQTMTTAPTVVAPVNNISSGNPVKHTSTGTAEYAAIPPVQPVVNRLWLQKSASPSLLPTGGKAVYTVTLRNDGTASGALDAIVDVLPSSPSLVTYDPTVTPLYNGVAVPAPVITGQTLRFNGVFSVPANGTSTLTFGVTVPNVNGVYVNSVTGRVGPTPIIIDATRDNTADSTPATASINVGPLNADLGVTKTDGVATVVPGEGITRTYTMVVTNYGPSLATSVVLNDTWPAAFTQGTVSTTLGTCGAGPSFSCTIGDLSPGQTATVTANYTVASGVDSGSATNSVTVSSAATDPGPNPNTATDSNTITENVVWAASKSFADATVPAGTGGYTFTIGATNNGLSSADNVVVTDTVAAGLTVTGVSCGVGGTNGTVGNAVRCTYPTVAAGASVAIQVTYSVPASTPVSTVSNTASVSSDEAGPTTAGATVDVTENVILGISKSFADANVTAGDPASHTFAIVVSNTGTTSADNAVISDTVNPALTVTGTNCVAIGGTEATVGNSVSCTGLTFGPTGSGTASKTLTVTYTVAATADTQSVSNTASVTSDEQALTTSAPASVGIVENVVLAGTKTFGASPVTAGSAGNTFTIQASNSGVSTADNVVIADTVNPALVVTGTNCVALGGTDSTVGNAVSCTVPTLASGFAVNLVVTYSVPAATDTQSVSNVATIGSDEQAPVSTPTASVSVVEDVVLSAVKTFTADPVTAGSAGNTFTIAVSNSGASTADAVVVTDTVDPILTITGTDCVAQGGSDATVGNTVSCTFPTVAGSGSITLTVTFSVPASADTGSITNVAQVLSDEQAATPSNSAPLDIAEDVILSGVKAFTDPTVVAGGSASSFTITLTNSGVSSADNVSITDAVDPALTVLSTDCATQGGVEGTVGNSVDCSFATIGPASSITITVDFLVDASEPLATVSNTANVGSDEQAPTPSNTDSVDVVKDVSLELVKSFSPAAVAAGSTSNQFTLQLNNNGTSAATSVVVTDTVDSRLSVVSVDCGAGTNTSVGQNLTCTYGSLVAGASETITVTYDTSASEESATISNTASAVDGDGNTASGVASLALSENVILAITKLPSPPSVIAGTGGHTFTIKVENLGQSDAEVVRVIDTFDTRLIVTGVNCGGGTNTTVGQDVECNFASLAPGGSATITVTYSVPAGVDAATVPNTALATDADGNAGSGQSSVEVVQLIDLNVVKQFTPAAVAAGSTGNQFTLTVTNDGISTADGVVVTDTVDSRLTITNVDCGTGLDSSVGQNITCTFATVPITATRVVTVTYSVDSSVVGTSIGNQVDVVDTTGLNTASSLSSVSVFGSILLSTSKTFSPATVSAGSTGNTFAITVTNAGLSDTTNVRIADAVDPALQVTNVSCPGATNTSSGQSVNCLFGSLLAGDSVTATVTYSVAGTLDAGTINNVANVVDAGGNVGSAFASVSVAEDVVLGVVKTFVEDPVEQGTGPYTFTIAVTNTGISDADNLVITDAVSASLSVTAVSVDTGGSCSPASNSVSCNVPTLAPGATATVTVTYNALAGASRTVTNTARASSDETVTVSTGSDSLSVVNPAISIVKTADLTVVNPGDTVTYTYTVTNSGDVYLSDIVVVDDAGTAGVPGDDVAVTCDSGAWPVAPGASISCMAAFNLIDDTTNVAMVTANPVTAGGADLPNLADVSGSGSESVNVLVAAMTIDKATSTPIIYRGATASYSYLVENTGDEPLTSVIVVDDRCPTTVFDSEISGNGDGTFDGGEIWRFTCSVALTGDVTNTAYATALDALSQAVTSPPDSVSVNVISPAVELRKFADAAQVTPTTLITYTIEVENLGDDPLVNVVVSDDTCGPLVLTGGDAAPVGVLGIGETWTFTCSVAAGTTDVVNIADVVAEDSLSQPVTGSDSVTVIVNSPPTPGDDLVATNQDVPVDIAVLTNDTDPDGVIDPTSVSIVSGPTNGAVSVNPITGVVTYTPDPGFYGPDSFTYEVCDDDGSCATAVVTVNVNGAPVPAPDSGTTNQGSPINLDVTANDTDPESDLLTVVGFPTPPANGSVVIDGDGTITYTPDPGFTGTEVFTYEVCDPSGACAVETVTVGINTAPIAIDDTAGTLFDTPVTIDVLGNDTDAEGNLDPTTVTIVTPPNDGTLVVDPVTGAVTYTPDAGFVGPDTFVYQVCDTLGACDTAVVAVTVAAANTAPTAVDDFDITDIDIPVTVDVLGNDTDAESNIDPTSVTVTVDPTNGTAAVDPVTGEITYTPAAGYSGPDQLTYQVCDTLGLCDSAILYLTVNEPPVALDDTATTNQDTPVVIDLLANDSDNDGVLSPSTVIVTSGPINGSVLIDLVSGEATYTPYPGYYGPDTFDYRVCDDSGSCAFASVTITVNGAPQTLPDTATTNSGILVSIDVLANDTDPEAGALTINSIPNPPLFGLAVINAGQVDYTPSPGFFGTDTFTYEVCDPQGACSVETVTVTVDGPPTAVDDAVVTAPITPVDIDVLANDSDPEGALDPTSVTIVSGPSAGTVSVNPTTGVVTYTPNAGVVTDSFEYQVCDSATPVQCDTAVVTVAIDDPVVNDPPVAVDDNDATQIATPVTTGVLANDIDPEGGPLTVTSVSNVTPGAIVVINVDGTITYTPPPGFTGSDSYTYEVCDDGAPALCDTAVVTVNVNAPPVAVADAAATNQGIAVVVPVLSNDSDPDGFLLPSTVTVVGAPANGATSVDPTTGDVTYTPDPGFFGTDTFTYEVCDNDGGCATATVTVDVNALPIVVSDSATAEAGIPALIDVLANDSDSDGTIDPTTVSLVSGPTNGTVTINPTTGAVTYTPNVGFAGTDTFVYRVCDNDGACASATVSVAVNGPPLVVDDTAVTNQGTMVNIPVLSNDSDPDGLDASSVSITSPPGNGSVTVNPDGTIDYTPAPGFVGTDAFSYRVCDTLGLCRSATVSVTVNGAPIVMPDSALTTAGVPVTLAPLANDSDPEGGTLVITGFPTPPANGSIVINPNGTVTYIPAPGFVGIDSFTYRACDALGACAVATISIRVNGPPIAVNDAAVTGQATPVAIPVLLNDVDPESALVPATVRVTSGPSNGTTTVNPATGVVTYTPAPSFTGNDSFVYEVCDDAGACASATVTVEVGNPPPIGAPDFAVTDEDHPVTIMVLANDGDPTGEQLFIGSVTQPANGRVVINEGGTVTYTPNPNFSGTDTFTYLVCDYATSNPAQLGVSCVSVNVTVTVLPINDAPVITSPTVVNVVPGEPIPPIVAVDAEGDSFTFAVIGGQLPPGVTLNPDGTFTGVSNSLGTYVFTVEVCDSGSPPACTQIVMSIVIAPLAMTGLPMESWLLLALALLAAGALLVRFTDGPTPDGPEPAES